MAAYDVRFEPPAVGVYRVGDEITCKASGYPAPSIHWQQVRSDGSDAGSSFTGSVLRIYNSMLGDNTWRCRAVNVLGSAEQVISYVVIGTVYDLQCNVMITVSQCVQD